MRTSRRRLRSSFAQPDSAATRTATGKTRSGHVWCFARHHINCDVEINVNEHYPAVCGNSADREVRDPDGPPPIESAVPTAVPSGPASSCAADPRTRKLRHHVVPTEPVAVPPPDRRRVAQQPTPFSLGWPRGYRRRGATRFAAMACSPPTPSGAHSSSRPRPRPAAFVAAAADQGADARPAPRQRGRAIYRGRPCFAGALGSNY